MKIHTTEALMKAEISRRSLMKTSALGSLALASSAFTLPFSQMVRAAEAPVEEKAVWSSCTVNCGSRCLLRLNRPGFPGECFICELRLPDHRFRWKHNKLFLLLPEEYGPAFPAIVDCYTSPPTLVWPVPLLHGFSSSYGVLPPLCKDH